MRPPGSRATPGTAPWPAPAARPRTAPHLKAAVTSLYLWAVAASTCDVCRLTCSPRQRLLGAQSPHARLVRSFAQLNSEATQIAGDRAPFAGRGAICLAGTLLTWSTRRPLCSSTKVGKLRMAYSCASCLLAAVSSQSMARMSRTPQYLCKRQPFCPENENKECKAAAQLHLLEHMACRVGCKADTPQLLGHKCPAAGRDAAKSVPVVRPAPSRGDT